MKTKNFIVTETREYMVSIECDDDVYTPQLYSFLNDYFNDGSVKVSLVGHDISNGVSRSIRACENKFDNPDLILEYEEEKEMRRAV